jgi:hypothetical protein
MTTATMTITRQHIADIINEAAKHNNLVHFNGGQAHIRVTDNIVMITDHTGIDPTIEIVEGEQYLKDYRAQRIWQSECTRNRPVVLDD